MMAKLYVCFISVLLSVNITFQVSTPSSSFYKAAALEYHPTVTGGNGTVVANINAKNYVKIIRIAKKHDVDIIVFPEDTLMAGPPDPPGGHAGIIPQASYLPDPKEAQVPCNDKSSSVVEALKTVSCAAKRYKMYVAVDIKEKVKCTNQNCGEDGYLIYNTNIVFDRTGALIARYRKFHLFGEPFVNITKTPDVSTFTTDFNVTFGHFVCFDIFFKSPAMNLIRDKHITDIVYPSYWFSELPLSVSTVVHSAWSYVNNVNVISSGASVPSTGSGGSGIFAGRDGPLGLVWSEKRTNIMLIAKLSKIVDGRRIHQSKPSETKRILLSSRIPTITGRGSVDQQVTFREDLRPYTMRAMELVNGTQNKKICNRGLCCHFKVDILHHDALVKGDDVNYYRYYFAVFKGVRGFIVKGTAGVENCAIIACTKDDPTSCNERFDISSDIVKATTFKSIEISGVFAVGKEYLHLPISMMTNLHPLRPSHFTFKINKIDGETIAKMVNQKPRHKTK